MQARTVGILGAFVSFAVVGAQACGSPQVEDQDGAAPTSEQICQDLYGADCGKSCDEADDCSAGLHCKSGKCAAECGGKYTCSGGAQCSVDGRCVGGNTGIPIGQGGATGTGGSGSDCVDVTVEFEKEIPNVVLLVDQSGSMCTYLPGTTTTRWAAVKNVLIGATGTGDDTGVVGELAPDVRFGLTTYAARVRTNGTCNGSSASGSITGQFVGTPLVVPLEVNNYQPIDEQFRALGVGRGTPTGQAFEMAAAALKADTHPGSKIIVLATDGEPGLYAPTGEDANGSTCADASCDIEFHRGCCPGGECSPAHCSSCGTASSCARSRVVHAVANVHPEIKTFVISVGTETGTEHLQEVANAGVGLDPDLTGPDAAKYYTADSQQDLIDAFREIIDGVRSCVFSLGGEVNLAEASKGTVRLNGATLEMGNQENGWRLNNSSEIELLGAACEAIKSGDPNLEIKFPCGAVVVR